MMIETTAINAGWTGGRARAVRRGEGPGLTCRVSVALEPNKLTPQRNVACKYKGKEKIFKFSQSAVWPFKALKL